jgi:glucan-binding YG repeat protein
MRDLWQRVAVGVVLPWLILLAFVQTTAHAEGTIIQTGITENTVWTKAGSPYYVNSWMQIGPNATLTIEPGVEVISQKGSGNGWTIYGKVIAVGTKAEPIELQGMYITAWTTYNKNAMVQLENTVITNSDINISDLQLMMKNSEMSGGYLSLSDTFATVENNYFHNKTRLDVSLSRTVPGYLFLKGNTFMNDGSSYADIQIRRRNDNMAMVTLTENNFFRTDNLTVMLDGQYTGRTFTGTNNYWGTTDPAAIARKIYDVNDNVNNRDTLSFDPFAYKPFANGYGLGALEAPRVQQVGDQATTITGATDADSTVRVTKDGNLMAEGTSSVDGTFQLPITKQQAGTQLKVTVTDSFDRSSETLITVKDETAPASPTIHQLTDQSTTVTGTAEANATITLKANGITIASGVADVNGNFTIAITKQTAGTTIQALATDTAGNVSQPATVIVLDRTAPAKPTITGEISDQSHQLQGTTEPGATVQMLVGNQVISTYQAGWNGVFYLSWYPALKAGTEITIVSIDNAGNRSEPVTLTVIDKTAPSLHLDSVFPPTTKNPVVKGTAEAGAVIQVLKNGQIIATGTSTSAGTFSITIPSQSKGTILTVVAIDSLGNKTEKTVEVLEFDVTPPAQPQVDEITIISTSVTGMTEPNTTIKVVTLEGTYYGTSDEIGRFSIAIPKQRENNSVYIWTIDQHNNESEMVIIQVKWTTPIGWYQDLDRNKFYYNPITGKMQTGWLLDAGKWYWFESDGKMKTNGFRIIGGSTYYFLSNGVMQTNWATIDSKKYYFGTDGARRTGLQTIDGKKYYFNAEGVMQTGWISAGGKWYFFQTDGTAKTGWLQSGGKWYFMNNDGTMKTGWLLSGGKWYFLNGSGAMQTGWLQVGGKWYYFNTSGAMVTGWVKIGTKTYYFNTSGVWVK